MLQYLVWQILRLTEPHAEFIPARRELARTPTLQPCAPTAGGDPRLENV
jgi:hypothetical protein